MPVGTGRNVSPRRANGIVFSGKVAIFRSGDDLTVKRYRNRRDSMKSLVVFVVVKAHGNKYA